jgi:predicted ribosomally synthesized peptide with SipW-like signal peptide
MSDNGNFEISRRKALAAVGSIGVASAGAGLGTSAFFSDQETFANNTLTAGSLDLKVDFEEHYADWMGAESEFDVEMGVPEDEADIYLPPGDGADSLARPISLAFPDATVAEFFDATSIDAYPDTDGDGIQDFPEGFDICEEDADTPDVLSSDLRTPEYVGDPLIELDDVKPGDFGEVTLSAHICDNPGYLWLFCDNFSEAENGITEPEADDPDEDGTDDGELAETIEVRVWRDDGDNIYEPESQPVDVYHLIDNSGTMEQNIVDEGEERRKDESAANVAIDAAAALDGLSVPVEQTVAAMAGEDDTTDELVEDTDDTGALMNAVNQTSGASGGTLSTGDFVAGLESAEADLVTDDPDDTTDDNILVIFTNGDSRPSQQSERDDIFAAADALKQAGVEIKTVAFGDLLDQEIEFHEEIADEVIRVERSADQAALDIEEDEAEAAITDNVEEVVGGEEELFRGTLLEFCEEYEFDPENGNLGLLLDGDLPAEEGGGMSETNCFSGSTEHFIGFEWWLPIDHGNEVQTDSVQFDLGFYTEQCRHNDGEGMANREEEEPQPT